MYELETIKSELDSIIYELDLIAEGVNSDFRNIGNDRCAQCIYTVSNRYREARRRLDNIDTSRLADGYGEN